MKTVFIGCVLSLLAIFLIPTAAPEPQVPEPAQSQVLFIAQPGQAETESTPAPAAPEKTDEEEAIAGDASQLQLLCGGQTLTARVRDYLTSVVLCEMPVTFAPEALKAQAVAARTFLWKQAACKKHTDADVCADSACCQAWLCEDALREKFGADYEAAVKKAAQAVSETADEVLCYNGELIDATYFSCSGGSTEAAVAVWGTDVPYLQPVASPGEEYAARYESEASFSLDAFRSVITAADAAAALGEDPAAWLGEITYTEGGGVDTALIGGAAFTGVQLRQLFGLNSTKFTLELTDAGAVFHVLGFGHRVGMSQYGADNLANNGFSYRVILQYYYQNTRIKKLSRAASGQYLLSDCN